VTQRAVDISNWQGDMPEQVYVDWAAAGVRTVSCGTSGNPQWPIVYAPQVEKIARVGMTPEAYIWLLWQTPDEFAERMRRKLDMIAAAPAPVTDVYMDCEDVANIPAPAVVEGLIALGRDIIRERGYETGVYTRANWWRQYVANSAGFGDLRLWLAHYDFNESLDSTTLPFGGWTECFRKQYTESGNVGGIFPLDLNVQRDPADPIPVPIPPAPGPDLVAVRRYLIDIRTAATAAEAALGGS
jgi:hypothetical protein